MSNVLKIDKASLMASKESLNKDSQELGTIIENSAKIINSIPNHDVFTQLYSKAQLIKTSLTNIEEDYTKIATNINNYYESMITIDNDQVDNSANTYISSINDATISSSLVTSNETSNITITSHQNTTSNVTTTTTTTVSNTITDETTEKETTEKETTEESTSTTENKATYDYDKIENYLDTIEGSILITAGLSSTYIATSWSDITSDNEQAYNLRELTGTTYDTSGFAKIGDRYVVKVPSSYGEVGDYIDIYLSDGTIIKCIIGDTNETNNIEFFVDGENWDNTKTTILGWHHDWDQSITKIVNKSNFFELSDDSSLLLDNLEARQAIAEIATAEINQTDESEYIEMFNNQGENLWCSEFVSWCAEKCGYIEAGIIPKYSSSTAGVKWFKEHNQFQDAGYEPATGDIIFYDYDGDGNADHTGLVVAYEDNKVITVEGNVGDKVLKCTHNVDSSSILGYGTPDYASLTKTE